MNLFSSMAGGALFIPCLILLPAIFAALIGIGLFAKDDIIEDQIYKIWASERSKHFSDIEYMMELGSETGSSALLAIASSRDEDNLFKEGRLEEIRKKMEKMEIVEVSELLQPMCCVFELGQNRKDKCLFHVMCLNLLDVFKTPQVKHKIGPDQTEETFTWNDVCLINNIGVGTVYQFPCVRLSAMDLWVEMKDYFTETDRVSWYQKAITDKVINPRTGKFGTLVSEACQQACGPLLLYRFSRGETLSLFSDLTAMNMNDPCRICVDTNYDGK
jgi:hypothetical protein